MTIATVIFTQNPEMWRLRECLRSHLAQTDIPDDIIIADFGSAEETRNEIWELIRQFSSKAHVLEINDNTELFHPARIGNTAAKYTSCDVVIFTGVDEIIGRNNIEITRKVMEQKNRFVLCSRINLPEMPNSEITNFVEAFDDVKKLGNVTKSPKGSYLAIRTSDLENIGWLDERFIGWGAYDKDIYWRAIRNGMEDYWINQDGGAMLHIWHPPRAYKNEIDIQKNEEIYLENKRIG